MTDNLNQLEEDLQILSREIAYLKQELDKLESGPEKDKLIKIIKDKQFQALFYLE